MLDPEDMGQPCWCHGEGDESCSMGKAWLWCSEFNPFAAQMHPSAVPKPWGCQEVAAGAGRVQEPSPAVLHALPHHTPQAAGQERTMNGPQEAASPSRQAAGGSSTTSVSSAIKDNRLIYSDCQGDGAAGKPQLGVGKDQRAEEARSSRAAAQHLTACPEQGQEPPWSCSHGANSECLLGNGQILTGGSVCSSTG